MLRLHRRVSLGFASTMIFSGRFILNLSGTFLPPCPRILSIIHSPKPRRTRLRRLIRRPRPILALARAPYAHGLRLPPAEHTQRRRIGGPAVGHFRGAECDHDERYGKGGRGRSGVGHEGAESVVGTALWVADRSGSSIVRIEGSISTVWVSV